MEQPKPEQDASNVIALQLAPRTRGVPPLTDKEVLQLRELLKKAEVIAASCPIAQRALSTR
jgi:hypothetical protein